MDKNNTLKNTREKMIEFLKERERIIIHEKLSAMSKEEFLKEWLNTVTALFGSNAINSTIEQTMKARGVTKGDIRYENVLCAIYQTYTFKAITVFQEFLNIDKENQKKKEN